MHNWHDCRWQTHFIYLLHFNIVMKKSIFTRIELYVQNLLPPSVWWRLLLARVTIIHNLVTLGWVSAFLVVILLNSTFVLIDKHSIFRTCLIINCFIPHYILINYPIFRLIQLEVWLHLVLVPTSNWAIGGADKAFHALFPFHYLRLKASTMVTMLGLELFLYFQTLYRASRAHLDVLTFFFWKCWRFMYFFINWFDSHNSLLRANFVGIYLHFVLIGRLHLIIYSLYIYLCRFTSLTWLKFRIILYIWSLFFAFIIA